ncbi:MAG: class I SAM-dependent methyltransferase [Promethearchaeia archaeon]
MKNKKIPFIKIKKKSAEAFFKFIKNEPKLQNLIDRTKKSFYKKEYVYFPIKEEYTDIKYQNILKKKINYEIIFDSPEENPKYIRRNLSELLQNKIPEKYFSIIPHSFDIVGSIAILEFNEKDNNIPETCKKLIADALMECHKNIKTVYEKKSEIKGDFRLRDLNLLSGLDQNITYHKENKCIFKVDIKNAFFTPRLIFERERISNLKFKENEIIVDLFAGIGPFSIQIAKKHKVKIIAFDINPTAINLLKENIKLNKIIGEIKSYNIDVKKLKNKENSIGNLLKNKANRIIMNLPEKASEFIDIAIFLLKEVGGIIHIYLFSEKPDPIKRASEKVKKSLSKFNWNIKEVLNAKIVKSFSPKADLVVLDLEIRPIK